MKHLVAATISLAILATAPPSYSDDSNSKVTITQETFPLLTRLLDTPSPEKGISFAEWEIDYEALKLSLTALEYAKQSQPKGSEDWLGIRMQVENGVGQLRGFESDKDQALFDVYANNVALLIDTTAEQPDLPESAIKLKKIKLPLLTELHELKASNVEFLLRDLRQDPALILPVHLTDVTIKSMPLLKSELPQEYGSLVAKGTFMDGLLTVNAKLRAFGAPRISEFEISLKSLSLSRLNPYLKTFAGVDASKGEVDVRIVASINEAEIKGTLYFTTYNAELVNGWETESSIWQNIQESIADMGMSLLDDGENSAMSGSIQFQGEPSNINLDFWQLAGTLISNAVAESVGKRKSEPVRLPSK